MCTAGFIPNYVKVIPTPTCATARPLVPPAVQASHRAVQSGLGPAPKAR